MAFRTGEAMTTKGDRRAAKRQRARYGHKVSGRSVRRIQEIIGERGRKAADGEPVSTPKGGRRRAKNRTR